MDDSNNENKGGWYRIEIQCRSCRGTGLGYTLWASPSMFAQRPFNAPDNVGYVCITCGGSAKEEVCYVKFTGKKRVRGVRSVKYFSGVAERQVSYEDFLADKMPGKYP